MMADYFGLTVQYIFEEWNRSMQLISPQTQTEGWFLMGSPFIPLGICGVYLGFIFHFQYWKPSSSGCASSSSDLLDASVKDSACLPESKVKGIHNCRTTVCLQYYNVFNVLINFCVASGLAWVIVRGQYSVTCEPVREEELLLAPFLVYLFHISKIVELGDTAFIIARGKKRQLTFLHVYHHTTILCATWLGARIVPGGTTVIIAMINCWIHVIMYSYYKVKASSTASHHHQNIIFKKLLTIVQILQFVTTIWICVMTLEWPCGYPSWVAISLILYMLTFVLLFGHFYVATYV